jgi:hypothetical protein
MTVVPLASAMYVCMHALVLHAAGHCAEVFADRLVPVMICYTKALEEPLAVLISV